MSSSSAPLSLGSYADLLRYGAGFALLSALYVVVSIVLTPSSPYPVHHDDYRVLAGGIADMAWWWKRPVSSNLIFLLSEFGAGTVYVAISLLTVAVAAMALAFLASLFAIRPRWPALAMFGLIVFSHASTFEHGRYLGLLTSLISHFFGLASLLLLLRAWRQGQTWAWLLAAACFLLSAFAKEDFILPPLLLIAFLSWEQLQSARAGESATAALGTRWIGIAAFIAIAAGCLFWNAYDRNPFIAGVFSPQTSSAAYSADLRPMALGLAFWKLFAGYVPLASLLALAACASLWWTAPRLRSKLVLFLAMLATLALPYAIISHNMPPFRAYAWLPWLAGVSVLAWQACAVRVGSPGSRSALWWALGLAMAAVVAWLHHGARMQMASYYSAGERINRRMISSLERYRPALAGQPRIGLRGLQGFSPWCGTDARYINEKLGYRKRWIVFVDAESPCYAQEAPDPKRKRGIYVTVLNSQRLCEFAALPVLDFDAQGDAVLRRADDFCTGNSKR